VSILNRNYNLRKIAFKIIPRGILIVVITIFLFELTYRAVARFSPRLMQTKSHSLSDYADTWRGESIGPGGFLKENLDTLVSDPYGNPVRWKNNAQGFRNDYDVTFQPSNGVVRIISLGDSFTAGYRLAQDETFSFLLEKSFNSRSDGFKYEVLISCIEEPSTGLYYLDKYGTSFRPHLVLLGITLGNDIAQTYLSLDPKGHFILDESTGSVTLNPTPTLGFNHGLESKLIPPSCVDQTRHSFADRSVTFRLLKQLLRRRRRGESIISWYGSKQYPKLFDPVNGLGGYLKEPPKEIQDSYDRLFRILKAFKTNALKNNYRFAVVIFPQRFQVQPEDWQYTVADYGLHEACFDLDRPNKLIADFCTQHSILCIDPTAAMTEAYMRTHESLFCPQGDMHPNAHGNRILFEAVKDAVYSALR
jgi:hypothetical protein